MEKAYAILAHKNPMQLLKLIRRLDDGNATFFIHIDKKVSLQDFQPVIDYGNEVQLVKRVHTYWGTFSLVEATLNALEAIKAYKYFDRIILLSGQDYPVKSNDNVDHFFRRAEFSVFIDYTNLPDLKKWPNDKGGLFRVEKYFFGLSSFQRFAAKAINFSATCLPFLRRKMPAGLRPYAGSQWWIIDKYALEYILRFIKENPAYLAFHKYTFAPDEVFFQTILLNSTDPKIKESITNNNMMYTRWDNSASSHPELLNRNDIEEMTASEKLFARKFDQENSSEVFDLLDSIQDEEEVRVGQRA